MKLTRRRKFLAIASFVFAAVSIWVGICLWLDAKKPSIRDLNRVTIGQREAEVYAILGPPQSSSKNYVLESKRWVEVRDDQWELFDGIAMVEFDHKGLVIFKGADSNGGMIGTLRRFWAQHGLW